MHGLPQKCRGSESQSALSSISKQRKWYGGVYELVAQLLVPKYVSAGLYYVTLGPTNKRLPLFELLDSLTIHNKLCTLVLYCLLLWNTGRLIARTCRSSSHRGGSQGPTNRRLGRKACSATAQVACTAAEQMQRTGSRTWYTNPATRFCMCCMQISRWRRSVNTSPAYEQYNYAQDICF